MEYGLLGKSLGHSYSKIIHGKLADYDYDLYSVSPEELPDFIEKPWQGLNVTVPYKKDVIKYCSSLSDIAEDIGAVNTLVREEDGSIFGDNTDYDGFKYLLKRNKFFVKGKKVLVLGSGGAAAAVKYVLSEFNANIVTISRTGENNYKNLDRHIDADFIINATPVGMYPDYLRSPLDDACIKLKDFSHLTGVIDLIYNPLKTKLLMDAEKLGIRNANGLYMLVAQAAVACELFTGYETDEQDIKEIADQLESDMKNIVLIGMPGSGKTSVGKKLAEELGRPFEDLDEEIIKKAGKSIPEIFESGEDAFRRLETETAKEFCGKSGLVISCGGGIVTREENYEILHANSSVVLLTRDIKKLPVSGRPLSIQKTPEKLWEERKSLYEKFADITISNDKDFNRTLDEIEDGLNL